MSRKEITVITDDISGEEDADTHTFMLDDVLYSIDLAEKNQAALYEALEPFIAHAVRVKPQRNVYTTMKTSNRSDPAYIKAVRQWAAENRIALPSRGRIPQSVRDAYDQR